MKQNKKLDTDQLFYYILNIQKMCHENQPSGFFKVWTFFRCFDRDHRELKQNNKFDTDQLFYYILNIQKMSLQTNQVVLCVELKWVVDALILKHIQAHTSESTR